MLILAITILDTEILRLLIRVMRRFRIVYRGKHCLHLVVGQRRIGGEIA